MKKKIKYLCFGFGQVAKYFIKNLTKSKKKFNFVATSTSPSKSKFFSKKKYLSLKFKNNSYDKRIINHIKESDYILVSIPPIKGKDLVIKYFFNHIRNSKFKSLVYLSSTSVYGDHKGRWVTEKSKTEPTSIFGKNRLNAENLWKKFQKRYSKPINVFRLSGIYSKENNIVKRIKLGTRLVVRKNNHFFSRVRVEDIASSIQKIFHFKNIKGEIFNVSDNLPASSEKVYKYAANALKIKSFKIISAKKIENKMLKSFYRDSKKVSNKKLKKKLKFKLKYPTYKKGLSDFIN